jgi:hypothetical protein
MYWSPVTFGKYKGKSIPQIIFEDPDWFYWAYENDKFLGNLLRQAKDVYKKSRNIRVPKGKKVRYNYHVDGTSVGFDLESKDSLIGSKISSRCSNNIDMYVPRSIRKYDKLGNKCFVKSIKYHILGDQRLRMTKKRCEDFFNQSSYFDI